MIIVELDSQVIDALHQLTAADNMAVDGEHILGVNGNPLPIILLREGKLKYYAITCF